LLGVDLLPNETLHVRNAEDVVDCETLADSIFLAEVLLRADDADTHGFKGIFAACSFEIAWNTLRNGITRSLEETDCDLVVVHSRRVEDICAATDYDKPKAHRSVVENELVRRCCEAMGRRLKFSTPRQASAITQVILVSLLIRKALRSGKRLLGRLRHCRRSPRGDRNCVRVGEFKHLGDFRPDDWYWPFQWHQQHDPFP